MTPNPRPATRGRRASRGLMRAVVLTLALAAAAQAAMPCLDAEGKTRYPLGLRLYEDKDFWNSRVLHMIKIPTSEAKTQSVQAVLGLSRNEANQAIAQGRREHGWRMVTGSSGMAFVGVPLQLGRHSEVTIQWTLCMSTNLGIVFCNENHKLCRYPIYYDKKNGQVIQFIQARRVDKKKKQSDPHLIVFKEIKVAGKLDESKSKVSIAGTRNNSVHEFTGEINSEKVQSTIAYESDEPRTRNPARVLRPRLPAGTAARPATRDRRAQRGPSAATNGDSAAGKVYPFDSDEISKPRLLSKVEPAYPKEARKAKISGNVMLAIEIWEDGLAHNIRVEKGIGHGLDEAAIEAVRRCRFAPGTKDGKPVRVASQYQVSFSLL